MAKFALVSRWLVILILLVSLIIFTPFSVLAGQGGGNTQPENNSAPLIIIGLVVVLVVAGLGLILSRRKK